MFRIFSQILTIILKKELYNIYNKFIIYINNKFFYVIIDI